MKNEQNINNSQTETFSIRISVETNKKVAEFAREHKWSRNFAINEILNQFLSCKQ